MLMLLCSNFLLKMFKKHSTVWRFHLLIFNVLMYCEWNLALRWDPGGTFLLDFAP